MQFLCSFKNYELLSYFEQLQRTTIDSATLFTSLTTKPVDLLQLLGPFQHFDKFSYIVEISRSNLYSFMHPVQLDHLSKFDKLNSFDEPRKILLCFAVRLTVSTGLMFLAGRID